MIGDEILNETDFVDKIFVFIAGVLEIIFITVIFYLKKGIRAMVPQNFFHDTVAKNLNKVGAILMLVSIGKIMLKFIKELSEGMMNIGIDSSAIDSKLFMIIISIFLMLTSKVINEGLVIKSENDLTI